MRNTALLVIATFVVAASAAFSQTQIPIVNYSFETPVANSGSYIFIYFSGGTSATLPGWTVTSGGTVVDVQNPSTPLANQDGSQVLEDFVLPGAGFNGAVNVSQNLTTSFVPGTTYTLTAYAGPNSTGNAQVGDSFFIANSTGTVLASTVINATTPSVLTLFTVTFTSTGLAGDTGPIQIGFSSPSQTAQSYMEIDNFSLTASSPAGSPAVTSESESAQVGSAFSYQIVATNSPTSFGAGNLPMGLSVNTSTGLISGTPTQSGTFYVALTATNSSGTGGGTLSLTVAPAAVQPPAVTSDTASGQVGAAFSYQIAATNSPSSFGASNLPPGLSVDASTGLISGTPTQSGTFTVGLSATNSGGTGNGTLSLTISAAPVQPPSVTSETATAQVGSAFSFQIVATNTPTSFGASGLPAGLSVDENTGLISGTPGQSGTFPVGLTATNSAGTGDGSLSLTVSPAPVQPPAVTSATASAQAGSAFSFQIAATNNPTSFAASGLPSGLSVDPGSGLISGTPAQSGTFTVGLSAANSGGAGTGTLTLTVAPAPAPQPTITLTSPPIDETVVTGSTVPLSATVNDPGGILSQVQFSLNGAALGAPLTAAPFTATLVAPAPGTYVLQAAATDNLGRLSTSATTLTVIAQATDPAAPSADLLTDVNGRNVGAGNTIIVTCSATSADGSPIQQVNFYANGTLFASLDGNGNPIALSAFPRGGALLRDDAAASTNTLFQAAFQIPLSASSVSAQYNLLAIAFSKLGTAQTSGTVTVTSIPPSVDQPPQIALAGLTSGQRLTTGSSYTASTIPGETAARAAFAGAPGGALSAVAKIEYYLNKLELLNANVSGGAVPNFTFTAPAPGQYIIEAIATDSAGVASVATPITVQVDPLPTVSVAVAGTGKAVVGGSKGKVVIARTGDTSSALKVSYKVIGTAVKGVDYDLAPATAKVLIPAGSASVKIKLKPIADPAATGPLTARIELRPSADGAYTLGSPSKAKITILQH